MRLPVRPRPHPFEQLRGYLWRLAHANGYSTPAVFWQRVAGNASPVDTLASLIDVTALPVFSGPGYDGIRIPIHDLGIPSRELNRQQLRWCPTCMNESPWFKPSWALRLSVACLKHRCWLKSAPIHGLEARNLPLDDQATDDTRDIVPDPVLRLAALLESSLSDRFSPDGPAYSFIRSRLTPTEWVRLIHFMGSLATVRLEPRGSQREARLLWQFEELCAFITAAGSMLDDWPMNFERALLERMRLSGTDLSLGRVFGPVIHAAFSPEMGVGLAFVRQSFEQFLVRHWRGEICHRHRRLSPELGRLQTRISLTKALRVNKMGRKTLTRILRPEHANAQIKFQVGPRTFTTLDQTQLSEYLAGRNQYLAFDETRQLLGISRQRLLALIQNNLVQVKNRPGSAGSLHWQIGRDHLHGFLQKLRSKEAQGAAFEAMVSLKSVLTYWRLTTGEFCALVADMMAGKVTYNFGEQGRFSGITFEETLLRSWIHSYRTQHEEWLSVAETAKQLGIKEQVVYELINRKLLGSDQRIRNGYPFQGVPQQEVTRFQTETITLAELATMHNTRSRHLLPKITAKPITGPSIDGSRQYFFKRADIPL